MIKSKKFIKSIGFMLIVTFILCFSFSYSMVKAFAKTNHDYIVVLNEDSKAKKQIEKQNEIEVKKTLKDNIIVINTNTDEAKDINKLEGVECVEIF